MTSVRNNFNNYTPFGNFFLVNFENDFVISLKNINKPTFISKIAKISIDQKLLFINPDELPKDPNQTNPYKNSFINSLPAIF